MTPLDVKDPFRSFGLLEREVIYFKCAKRCASCDKEVAWPDAEIHHILPHSMGGKTSYENAALVHNWCHPKTQEEVTSLACKISRPKGRPELEVDYAPDRSTSGYEWKREGKGLFMADGSRIRMSHKGMDYFAEIVDGKFVYNGRELTPAKFANEIAGGSRNAWECLFIQQYDDDTWTKAQDMRADIPGQHE